MNRELWVHASGELAVTEDQRLVEFFPAERQDTTAQSILLGRVERIVPGLQAAFVDIGEARNGFLPLQEGSNTFLGERLQCGDRIPVQVKREAHGEKGAFLTRDVTLAGETLLYMPCNRYIGVSHRVQDRERLQALGQRLSGHAFGIVLRTAAQEADEAEIASELAQLQADWAQALHLAATGKPPCVLWQPASLAEQLLQDYQSRGGAILRTESDEGQWQRLRQEAHAA